MLYFNMFMCSAVAISRRSVNDVLAADLPQDIKKDLKLLAHEIAGALVFDLCTYACDRILVVFHS